MTRKRLYSAVLACALMASCSSSPGTPSSPSGATPTTSALNPDGSSLKVTPPAGLSPNGSVTDSRRPTLSFNASSGRFTTVSGVVYELEVLNANNTTAYTRNNVPGTAHALESDLTYADNYTWRVRARVGTDVGPWSGIASFRTPDPPGPPPPPVASGGQLPFPIPAACGPGDPNNRFACAAAVAALSAEWNGCAAGSGTRCHRFTRQVVFALAASDPEWKMIQAAPGGNGCNCNQCGPSDGTWFREDTTVYGGNRVFDMVIGAGGPTPSLTWSAVPGPRPGDIPTFAPLCVP